MQPLPFLSVFETAENTQVQNFPHFFFFFGVPEVNTKLRFSDYFSPVLTF
jgi:hypothetical protein